MEFFFEEPSKDFQLREISRLAKIAVTSTKKYLQELAEENLVEKNKKKLYPSYKANETSRMFKIYKIQNIMLKLYKIELIDFLEDELHPRCIIIFGSMRKGEYTKKSDLDLFVQCKEKKIDLIKYEKIIKHKINIFFEEKINRLSKELLDNIVNGIKLSGHLKI